MKWPRIRLLDLLMWTFSFGIGFALCRFLVARLSKTGHFAAFERILAVESILFAFVMIEGIGLCVEVALQA